jgi:guanylate kinase
LRNFGPSARPGAQILEIFFSGAQFTKARMQNAIAQFLKRVERAEFQKWHTKQATHSKERRNSALGETNET